MSQELARRAEPMELARVHREAAASSVDLQFLLIPGLTI